MLQQTQAARVQPAYRAFLRRFPRVTDLAQATLADVLTAWRGLGYNRRARNLHRAASTIAEEHGGAVPGDLRALRALPGVGDYTARAVLTFGFGRAEGPVDTNVARVLARAIAGEPLSRRAVQHLADRLVAASADDPATWNHALMDLGARVCTARVPHCGICPVAAACRWRAAGGPRGGDDPAAASAVRPRPQGTFAGSDRYHRGRLIDSLRRSPLDPDAVPGAARLPAGERLSGLLAGLEQEGLVEWRAGSLRLPGTRTAS
ncbi:MAG: A/G-specific adenine glycosylase [Nitriliruptorales bacterium]|nr:A/G-specific adenine glycosylase [Nitriliruptorales bacterium]